MHNNNKQFSDSWAVILGGSSGFGIAAVEKLATHGMNIAVLYREPAITEKSLIETFLQLAGTHGVNIAPFNLNALDESGRGCFY